MKIILSVMFFVMSAAYGCADKTGNGGLAEEMAARSLGGRAMRMEAAGRPHESAKILAELRDKYSRTKYFVQLTAELEAIGISLETPLVSHTSNRMFKLQNLVLRYKKSRGYYPAGHVISVPEDMWGHRLVYKIFKDKSKPYEMYIFSKGPDGKERTDDDIYLIHEGAKSQKGEDAENPDEESVVKQPGKVFYAAPPREPGFTGRPVNIEQLEKMLENESAPIAGAPERDVSVSLEEIGEMNGGGNVRRDKQEVTVTLDDLLLGKH
ncbi:MAG: hypothetical protein IEMM0002_1053 [bacterium]|nr:MAG: hypothetical protein IEMM0002_1053 [bacterium]